MAHTTHKIFRPRPETEHTHSSLAPGYKTNTLVGYELQPVGHTLTGPEWDELSNRIVTLPVFLMGN